MAAPTEQEFVVRVPPRDDSKKFHVMKFNASYNQEISKWTNARMVRENNQKILQSNIPADDDPKFGAGSVAWPPGISHAIGALGPTRCH